MPAALDRNLKGLLSPEEIDAIYGSITTANAYPNGSPEKDGVVSFPSCFYHLCPWAADAAHPQIQAYTHVMKLELIPATVLAVIPFIAAFFVYNVYFSDKQNEVEEEKKPALEVNDKKQAPFNQADIQVSDARQQ